jgi:hypothetical protein
MEGETERDGDLVKRARAGTPWPGASELCRQMADAIERLTRERDDAISRRETAEAHLNERLIQSGNNNLLARAKAAEAALATAREALETGIKEVETIGDALHNDGFVYANNAWRVVAAFRAALAAIPADQEDWIDPKHILADAPEVKP